MSDYNLPLSNTSITFDINGRSYTLENCKLVLTTNPTKPNIETCNPFTISIFDVTNYGDYAIVKFSVTGYLRYQSSDPEQYITFTGEIYDSKTGLLITTMNEKSDICPGLVTLTELEMVDYWLDVGCFIYSVKVPISNELLKTETIHYTEEPVAVIKLSDNSGWWGWGQKIDVRDIILGPQDYIPTGIAKLTINLYDKKSETWMPIRILQTEGNGKSGVLLTMEDNYVLGCSYGTQLDTMNGNVQKLGGITLMWCIHKAEFGKYKIEVELKVRNCEGNWNVYKLTTEFDVKPDKKKLHNNKTSMTGKLNITPTCICYLNKDNATKTVAFNYSVTDFGFYYSGDLPKIAIPGYENLLLDVARCFLRLRDKNGVPLQTVEITNNREGTVTFTFELPENTKADYEIELFGTLNGTEFRLDSQEITILRQKYCHSIKIDVKMYDKQENEIAGRIPHPTSADWTEEQYGEIKVKITITDEQGKFVDVPIDKITTNWQYPLTQIDVGQFEFTIPNTDTDALGLGQYGISVYIDKDWCEENGYLNSYNIEAEDVIINNNMIEKVMYIGAKVDHYENGITYLNNTYETLTGIFVNAQKEFKVVQQMQEATQQNQYTFCYTPFISSQTLNLPTYTDEEKKKLARAIVRALGRPRKKETFTILDKYLPKLNQVITLDVHGQLRTVPIYALKISIAHKLLSIMISNDEEKLLKDYLSMIK
ncbi:hypothetical protein ACO3VM_02720 [Methanocaldococcus sp. 10A]